MKKNILLVIALIVIVAVITFIEVKKPVNNGSTAPDVTIAPLPPTLAAAAQDRTSVLAQKSSQYKKAKELVAPSGFINAAPFKLSDMVGKKVILVDFWTYSCINCQRTIPYLNTWYNKYKDDGLVIVGVHTPEFDFEKNIDNVTAAVQKAGIKYPVVLDNDMGTWNAYANEYWPHEYLIDIDGYVAHDHIGEGDYAVTESAIQAALNERNTVLGITTPIPTGIVDPATAIALDNSGVQSPETYFGAERNQYLGNGTQGKIENQTLVMPSITQANTLYLDGTWNFQYQYAETVSDKAHIAYQYNAKHVYMVASAKHPVTLKLTLDGQPHGTVTVQANQLYDLIDGTDYGAHTLQIEVEGSGLDAYTFTFG